jgi:hypothetical protein
MKFVDAVNKTKEISSAYRVGLKAIENTHRNRIKYGTSKNITGSVNLDDALRLSHPTEPRWDYGIGYLMHNSEKIHWVEFHPASSGHIEEVLNKLEWLKNWLQSSATKLNAMPKRFVWVASGKVHLPRNSPQRRRLAEKGLFFAGESVSLD